MCRNENHEKFVETKNGPPVKGKARERLSELCSLAANELDHNPLMALVKEINDLFESDGTCVGQQGKPSDAQPNLYPVETYDMPKRNLRIVNSENPMFAVCERCGARFSSSLSAERAEQQIKSQFDSHRCEPKNPSILRSEEGGQR